MLFRFGQVLRVGRFAAWDTQSARSDEARFRRLTLIYGRNASGKSTLARVCRAAAAQDTNQLELDRTLGNAKRQEVTLDLDSGTYRYNGATWVGTAPKVLVFDRKFIEENVYVGRRFSREHRKQLLRLALGEEDVTYARALDELSRRGRQLATDRAPHDATIIATARDFELAEAAFVALPPIDDIARALEVITGESEERLGRILSDGDRSTLAFSIFLLRLEETEHLDEHIVIFDDPMTSLDTQRTEATAEQITNLALRAKQVIVLSHHASFLRHVAYDWSRHQSSRGNELVELELDKATKVFKQWSSGDHLKHEQERRLADLDVFISDRGQDRHAPRIQGEIRKLLEAYVRTIYPQLFASGRTTLEPIIRLLKDNDAIRATTRFSPASVLEMERLCAFSAREHHDGSGLGLEVSSPEQVREMARRALDHRTV